MMRKLYILCVIGLVSVIGLVWAQENITITTYYPAPYGVYNIMKANVVHFNPVDKNNVNNPQDAMVICDSIDDNKMKRWDSNAGGGLGDWVSFAGQWTNVDDNLYPNNTNWNVGIGTTEIPHGGIGYAKFAIEGANASAAGPHLQYTTASNNYPLFQQLNWTHDNVSLNFDSYYDGTWRSSDPGSNFQIYKIGDLLRLRYDSGVSPGNALSWENGIILSNTGRVGIGINPSTHFHVADPDTATRVRLGNSTAEVQLQFDTNEGDWNIRAAGLGNYLQFTQDLTSTEDSVLLLYQEPGHTSVQINSNSHSYDSALQIYNSLDERVFLVDDYGRVTAEGTSWFNGDFHVAGRLTKGTGGFDIEHPDPLKEKEGWRLRHSFVESPTGGDNLYRWTIEVANGEGIIDLPGYFKYLNENIQVWVSPKDHFGRAYGFVDEALSNVTVRADTDGLYNVLVMGMRKDKAVKRSAHLGVEYKSEQHCKVE